MPRYFLDLHDDLEAIDRNGVVVSGLAAAKAIALSRAREMIRVSVSETGRIDLRPHIDIRDESGVTVHVLHFEDAVTIKRRQQVLSIAATRSDSD